jgi:putative salt-induced outer membrane protein
MRKLLCAMSFIFAAQPLFAADPPPAKPWSGSVGAGLAVTSGNSDTKNLNLAFTSVYDPKTRMVFKADALYLRGESGGVKQVDKASASAREEYNVSPRTFAFAEVSYLRDPFKDIDYLVAPVAGAGYRVIQTATRNLTVDGALGFIVESNASVGRSTSGAIKSGENYDQALSPTSKITQKLTGLWKTSDFADSLYHFDAGLTTTITTRLELKIAYGYDYKNKPPNPSVKKGDSALFATVLFKY